MNQQPTWLHEQQIRLSNGDLALWSYDSEGDVLEIFFHEGPASGTIELTDGIMLRYNREKTCPLSISFIAATTLLRQQEYGQPLLVFNGLANLPKNERELVVKMLQSPPLNTILQIYSFKPTARARLVPVAAIAQLVPLPA